MRRFHEYQAHRRTYGPAAIQRRVIRALAPVAKDIDTIVCRGHSGIIGGAFAAAHYRLALTDIRKDKAHGLQPLLYSTCRCAIVDDFLQTGATLAAMLDYCERSGATPLYLVLYSIYNPHKWASYHNKHYSTIVKYLGRRLWKFESLPTSAASNPPRKENTPP